MAEAYDVQAIMNALKEKDELDPFGHDGSYDLMRETIVSYSKMPDLSELDYKDLNLVYLTSVGTWKQGIESKKKTVDESHLTKDLKEVLKRYWDEIWKMAEKGFYSNQEKANHEGPTIGMFGTGFFSFQNKTTKEHVQAFIKMCIDILQMQDENKIYDRAEQTLTTNFRGMRAASASMILHCLRPYAFPIINANMGNKNIFEVLGVNLNKKDSLDTYIENCRKIKAFRDKHFAYKNYRIFDMASWNVKEYIIGESDSKDSKKAWLITWNKDNWDWDKFAEKCDRTKNDITFVESWACASSSPKIGDEVFLIKLGAQPRGIIGHGIVNSTIYEKEHYDPAKAAEGKREKCIDVVFDRLINYEIDKFISQKELVEKCGLQHWSPQGSGIEIKPEVLPVLKALWDEAVGDGDGWWPSLAEYDPGISKEVWKDFLLEDQKKYPSSMKMLKAMLDLGGECTCKRISDYIGGSPQSWSNRGSRIGGRIIQKLGMPPFLDEGTERTFPIPFFGKDVIEDGMQRYAWKLREPLKEALLEMEEEGFLDNIEMEDGENIMKNSFAANTILYGPPGTGKTYHTVSYAVAICEGKSFEKINQENYMDVLDRYNDLKDEGRIEFTTFHQSYGYEEFIEGIKPILDTESESLGYSIEDGVFKEFCKRARAVNIQADNGVTIKDQPRIWLMILGGPGKTALKQECFKNNEVRIGWSHLDDDQWDEDEALSAQSRQMLRSFTYEMEKGDIVFIVKDYKSIDAIGVIDGDYKYDKSLGDYPRSRDVQWLVKDINEDMIQYLPKGRQQLARYTVCAMKDIGLDVISHILKKYAGEHAISTSSVEQPYVFIIDEINRGNISKIFGELITLIEDTKRAGAAEAMEATLPYSGETFSVPENVYILGTMNTADRSIALMDTALRRRFEFKEMMPNSEVLESLGVGTIVVEGTELNVARMLDVINERIEYLFDREHTIGHAFFTKLADDPTIETLAGIFEKNVIPLLQEYFYEDYEKIQLVLGDNAKEDEYKFVLDKALKIKNIFNGNPDIDLPEKGYIIQREAFYKVESYKQIGKDL